MPKSLCKETKLSNFIPVPINLLHMELSSSAILVYGFLLSRGLLSTRNGWMDDGKAYVRYSNHQLMKDTGLGLTTIKNALTSLERQGLICREVKNKHDRKIFLFVPEESVLAGKEPCDRTESTLGGGRDTGHHKVRNVTTNIYGENIYRTNKYDCGEGESF